MITGQLIRNMKAGDYFSLRRVSKSALDKLARSPAHMRAPSGDETKAMRIGKALHALALEGIAPLVRPEFSGKGSVAARAEWDAAHEGQTILSEDEAAQVHGMAAHIALHPVAGPALRRADGIAEASILWTCEQTGAECKSRLDWLLPGIVLDIKTSADARPDAFVPFDLVRHRARMREQVQPVHLRDLTERIRCPSVRMNARHSVRL